MSEETKQVNLADLVGAHKLTGVDYSVESIEKYGHLEDCQLINFVLDGVTYTAVEDPVDGYRSCMKEIKVSDFKVTNKFKAVKVVGTMRRDGHYKCDILDLIDAVTGKIVLSVGTYAIDDYYPSFVSDWIPENLVHNVGKS